jgi:cyclopropane fatty-acyl-phospholipid synthase-like methyltransferase
MSRLLRRLPVLLLLVPGALVGCRKPARTVTNQVSLTLALPPGAAGRSAALEVDGHEVTLPAREAPLLVTPAEGKDGVTLTYTFWPDAHAKVVRTKRVTVGRGEAAEVSLLKEDAATPDRIYAVHQPTPTGVVEAMCQMAKVGKDDVIYDVGCGDGQTILTAVQKGGAKRGVGLDYAEEWTRQAEEKVRKAGLADKVIIVNENVLERKDFSRANVILLSWTSPVNERLKRLLQTTLRHGTRIVSCRSGLGNWRPDATRTVKDKDADGREVEFALKLWTVRHPKAPNLELELPDSEDPPDYAPERVSKLLVDGKDFTTPRVRHRSLAVEPKEGKDSVKVVFTFWPNTYTEITRTKTVKLEKGKLTRASLLKQDPASPDHIKPIYVPTPDEVVEKMCQMAKIGKDDVVYDIGCGDGRLVILSVKKYGARKGIGIDIRPELVKLCQENAKKEGVNDKVTFEARDAQKIEDFSEASVVLLYLGDHLNERLKPALRKTLKPGARIVSHRFRMGSWEPEKTEKLKAKDNDGTIADFELHLWTIK